jgi:hypothetical protein
MCGPSRRVLAALLAASLAGCASNPAPKGWLPPAVKAQEQAYGGWISLTCRKAEAVAHVEGELIAVSDDRVYVLTDTGLVEVPHESVAKATLAAYATGDGQLAGWSALGTLSTLSHGGYLLITAPLWIIAGITAAAGESRAGLLHYPEKPLASFRPYARFPQGLPAGLEASALGRLKGDVTSGRAAPRSPGR